jgi:hypothetical protein
MCVCICFLSVIIPIFVILIAYSTLSVGGFLSGLWLFAKYSLYTFGIGLYLSFLFTIILKITKSGIDIFVLRYNIKREHNNKGVKQTLRSILNLILINLLFLVISACLAFYFEIWYIRFTFAIYFCYILGYVASFPLSEEQVQKLISNSDDNQVKSLLTSKSILNSTIFFAIYFYYYNYF